MTIVGSTILNTAEGRAINSYSNASYQTTGSLYIVDGTITSAGESAIYSGADTIYTDNLETIIDADEGTTTVTGGTYGVYYTEKANGRLEIGNSVDTTPDEDTTISGGQVGLVADNGFYFYGGTLEGTNNAYSGEVLGTLTNYAPRIERVGSVEQAWLDEIKDPELMEREGQEYVSGVGYVYYVIGTRPSSKRNDVAYNANQILTITLSGDQTGINNANVIDSWDVSLTSGDMAVMAWITDAGFSGDGTTPMYHLYIGANGDIIAPVNSTDLFRNSLGRTVLSST